MPLSVKILTLFSEMFPGVLGHSLAGKALEKGIWSLEAIDIRQFATDKHQTVDDSPFGGGAGMVMRADVVQSSVIGLQSSAPSPQPSPASAFAKASTFAKASVDRSADKSGRGRTPADRRLTPDNRRLIYLSPRGKVFNQAMAEEFSKLDELVILCGRYEGIDERAIEALNIEEISIGDFVLSGGEPAAMVLLDACVRLLPGVIGNEEATTEESFAKGLLEYPLYTRPAVWTDANGIEHKVPEVLLSGDHEKIRRWRQQQSEEITKARRPDLWEKHKALHSKED